MDKTDIGILKALQEDGRASAQQLSETVGLSAAPVWRRVKALEANKVITGYSAQVDRSKVGLQGCMFAQISLERHSAGTVETFERSVRDAPEILECYAVTGDSDFLLKILVESRRPTTASCTVSCSTCPASARPVPSWCCANSSTRSACRCRRAASPYRAVCLFQWGQARLAADDPGQGPRIRRRKHLDTV